MYVHISSDNKAKRKRKKSKVSFCQQFVSDLIRDEANAKKASKTAVSERATHSTFLGLPAELRTQILSDVLEDQELEDALLVKNQNLNLSRVCQAFKVDMIAVSKLWKIRAEKAAKEKASRTGAFDSYIADLMGPLKTASAMLSQRKHLPGVRRKQAKASSGYDNRRREFKKTSFALSAAPRYLQEGPSDESHWHSQRWVTRSQAELEEVSQWHQKRKSKLVEMKTAIGGSHDLDTRPRHKIVSYPFVAFCTCCDDIDTCVSQRTRTSVGHGG